MPAMNPTADDLRNLRHTDVWFDYQEFYAWIAARADFRRFAEVGVWKGHSISFLAQALSARKDVELYGVDLFEASEDFQDRPDLRAQLPWIGQIYEANLKSAGVRRLVRDVPGRSDQVPEQFPIGYFDFVFLDADHTYEQVLRDIAAWRSRVRVGGILAGHDYNNRNVPGVRRAVLETFGYDRVRQWGSCWWFEIDDLPPESLTLLVGNYNKRPYLEAFLESLVAQTSELWQCLIVDDGSSDGSWEYLCAHPLVNQGPRIRAVRHPENQGIARTLSELIELAATDIVAIADADDALHPQCIERVLETYRQQYRGFVYTNFTICDEVLRPREKGWCSPVPPGSTILDTNCASHLKTFRRFEFAKTSGLDPTILSAVDKDLVYRLEEVTTPYFIPQSLYYWRKSPDSFSLRAPQDWQLKAQTRRVEAQARLRRLQHALVEPIDGLIPDGVKKILIVGEPSAALLDVLGWRHGRQITALVECAQTQRRRHPQLHALVPIDEIDEACAKVSGGAFDCVIVLPSSRIEGPLYNQWSKFGALLAPEGMLLVAPANVRRPAVLHSLLHGHWLAADASLAGIDPNVAASRSQLERWLYRAGFDVVERAWAWELPLEQGGSSEKPEFPSVSLNPGESDADVTAGWLLASARRQHFSPSPELTSIVILTHNQLAYTKLCLESLRRYTDEPYEVIVVDNASTDGTLEYLRTQADVKLIVNSVNRGFPAGCNQGIAASRGSQVLLLNNDVIVSTGWLRRMLAALGSSPEIGLVGPSSNCVSGPQQIEVSYREPDEIDAFAWEWGRQHAGQREVIDRLVGFCLLVDRRVFDQLGVLDEQFGVGNFEDDDLCRRALAAGFRAVIARDAFVHHFGGATFRATTNYAQVLKENERRFRAKWQIAGGHSEATLPNAVPAANLCPEEPDGELQRRFRCRATPDGLLLEPTSCRLSLCMIVRDSAATLNACLASIAPWVDELVIVDTGSVDETREIAARYGARVYEFPWIDDFAAARNESLRHARGDWIFWMDADDTMPPENGRQLRRLIDATQDERIWGYVMQVHCPGGRGESPSELTIVDHIKLFRRRPEIRFEFRIHEQVLPSIRAGGGEVAWTDLFVVHSGSDRSPAGRARKQERDLRLLQLELQDRPGHPFALFNLGMTYADMGEHRKAAETLEAALNAAEPHESHVRKLYALLVGSQMQCGATDRGRERCREGLGLFPVDPELCFRAAMLAHEAGQWQEAERYYLTALAETNDRHFSSRDHGICGHKARYNLAIVYRDMGRRDDAERLLRQVVMEVADFAPAWIQLGELLLEAGELSRAKLIADEMLQRADLAANGLVLHGQVARTQGDHMLARRKFLEAVCRFPGDTTVWNAWCQFLFEHGVADEAVSALEQLAQLSPDDGAVFHNLGTAQLRAGRKQQAIRAFERSLAVRPDAPHTLAQLGQVRRSVQEIESRSPPFAGDGKC